MESPATTSHFESLLSTVRRHLHQYPEVGLKEYGTAAYIREVLEKRGLVVKGPVAGTGLFTDITGKPNGRKVGFRADVDALPIADGKSVPYRSRHEGVAHLCGHDAHTAIGIGAAVLLHQMRHEMGGTVRVFFQPNEEGTPNGAPMMIREGILDGLEAVFACHVDPALETGRFGLIEGAATSAIDRFQITVRGGRTGHSARPHLTVDTMWVAIQIAQALYPMTGRLNDARNPAVLTITQLHGGEAFNVIPAEVTLGGSLRTTDPEDREKLVRHIRDAAVQIGSMYGARIEVENEEVAAPVINDPALVGLVRRTIRNELGEGAVFEIPRLSMGSEDFGYYLEHVPGALIRVGTSSGPETSHPLHDSLFDIDEAALAPTARLMAQVLLNFLRS